MAEFRVTAPRNTDAMGSVYGAAPDSSVQWLRQYLPTAAGDFLAEREQQALQPTNAREVAGDVLTTAMNVLPAGPRLNVPRSQGIKAYHGSPYDFDRFDLSKIGTGEGAQMYGHGLYFAENPSVAQTYKNMPNPQVITANNARMAELAREMAKLEIPGNYRKYRDPRGYELAAEYDRLMDEKLTPKGKMYEVNINAAPEHFLDWDKPLRQQSPDVQSAIGGMRLKDPLGGIIGEPNNVMASGQEAYRSLARASVPPADLRPGFEARSPFRASEVLRDAGIPGIRYLDQGSRSEGAGTSNYVLFNDKIIDILRKYGLAGGMAGAGAASQDQSSQ